MVACQALVISIRNNALNDAYNVAIRKNKVSEEFFKNTSGTPHASENLIRVFLSRMLKRLKN